MKPPLDGPTMIALILIASFAIDRMVTAVLFLLSFVPNFPEAEDGKTAAKTYKLIYFFFGGVLAVMFLAYYGQVRLLSAMNLPASPFADTILTGIVLVGGADRIAALLNVPSASEEEEKPPSRSVRVSGTLTLEEDAGKETRPSSDET